MNGDRVERRLAAVMAADVVGYSRLMGLDDIGTLTAFKQHRAALIDPAIAERHGRIVKLMGDGLLVEFRSVVDAVECAVAIQLGMARRAADTPDERRITLRIGINLGDVIIDDDDIYGDGVNVAARLEAQAEPGGICVSEDAHRQVAGKVDRAFQDMGALTLKNIAAPVRAYRVVLDPAPTPVGGPTPAGGPLPLPDKPSIAVLPFASYSADPEQEHVADGLVEDLITDLSKVSGLFVVARNSSAAFKGQPIDVRTAAARLGVRFVVEGSVRRAGDRVRVNAQLIQAESGGHLWAERYDGSSGDIFAFQDEVCAKIVSALSVTLSAAESDHLKTVHTTDLDAYELFVRARATPYPPVPERIASARAMFEQVIARDPDFAGGYAGVSAMMSFAAMWSHGDADERVRKALELADKAIAVDDSFGWSHTAKGMALWYLRQYEDAIASLRRAVALRPNDADARVFLGLMLGFDGRYEAAVEEIDHAIRLNPLFFNGPYLNVRGQTLLLAEAYEDAVATFRENVARGGPVGPPALCWGAAVFEALGQHEEAARLAERLARDFPGFTIENWNFFALIRSADARARIVALMNAAGIA